MVIKSYILKLDTEHGISIFNLTAEIEQRIKDSGIKNGFVVITSRHTTTAIGINEYEERLLKDIQEFFKKLVPEKDRYWHNDIHLRDCPPDEPENAHSHLIALLLGGSENIPIVEGKMSIGQWQSILLFELDGPRKREVAVQIIGE